MNLKNILSMVAMCIFVSGCSLFGKQGVEMADYTVIKSQESYEVRQYHSMIIAKTTVANSDEKNKSIAFNRLFEYISGSNKMRSKIAMTAPVLQNSNDQSEKIAMTAPVLMSSENKEWTMAFIMPDSYRLETAPEPLSADITIEEVKAHKVVALTFSGFLNEKSISSKTGQLQKWLDSNNYKSVGQPIVAGYDPPWTIPFFRRNEIHIPVE
jgi:hypothetical protein